MSSCGIDVTERAIIILMNNDDNDDDDDNDDNDDNDDTNMTMIRS